MSRRKIVFAVATSLTALAMSDSGTFALFYDVEASVGNRFTGWTSPGWTQGNETAFNSGTHSNVDTSTSPGEVLLAKGSAIQQLYAFRGGGTTTFYRYSVTTAAWATVADAPGSVTEGASLAFDGGRYIYALQGGSGAFWRYDTTLNTWAVLGNAPGTVGDGGDLAYDNGVLYALQGGGGTGLWKYDIAAGSWTAIGSTPQGVGSGGALASYQGTLYVMQGSGTRTIWAYNNEAWSNLSVPSTWLDAGWDLVLDQDGKLYALYLEDDTPGGSFAYSYDIPSNTWTKRNGVWSDVRSGVDLASDGEGYIYALRVQGDQGGPAPFWRYDVSGNKWSASGNLPDMTGVGACLVSVMLDGQYAASGTMISSVFDAGTTAVKYNALSWRAVLPPGTEIRFDIRAADTEDGLQGEPWTPVESSSASISAIYGRYVQWRATLISTDPYQTPTLQEVRLSYDLITWTSSTWVQTTADDFNSGMLSDIDTAAVPGSAMLTADPVDKYVYAFQGGGSSAFYRYNVASNTWATVADAPGSVTEGASLAFDGGRYIYALQGGSGAFWRYDTTLNTWAVLGNAPGTVGDGGDLAYDNGVLYALQGGGGTGLWKYDIAAGSWTAIGSTPQGVGSGGALASYQGTLYVMQGSGTLTIWTYHDGIWTNLNTPSDWAYWLDAGWDLVLESDGRLYVLLLDHSSTGGSFAYSYDIPSNTWTQRNGVWSDVRSGIDLTSDEEGNIYALRARNGDGGWDSPFKRYDVPSNEWSHKRYLPGTVGAGASLVSVTLGGQHASQGILTSSTFDTGTAGTGYDALFWGATLPSGTAIRFEVRASDTLVSGQPDAEWVPVSGPSGSSLDSLSGQYVQWKAILTTDDPYQTPTLQEVKLYYRG